MAEKKKSTSTSKAGRVAAARRKASAVRGAGTSQLGEFMNFVREQGVVGLAIGLAIGASAGAAVKSIVDNFINPVVGFIIGGNNLAELKWHVVSIGSHTLTIGWGAIISALITLTATAFVVYLIVHLARLDRLDKKKEA